ncbi:MAG: restriction endonuclease subunit S, partial [Fusobacteriaceae bacterium]
MKELKDGWKTVKLGDISDFISGYAFKGNLFSKEGCNIIKIKNVNGKFVDISSTEKYPKELCENLDKYKLKNNDILISMTGAGSVGRVSKFRYNGLDYFYINQRVGKIVVNPKKAISEYIFQIISTQKYEKILFDMANGSGQPNLSPGTIRELEISLPPLETQEKIASILSSLDDKIELNNEMNKTLEEMAQTLFKRWFIDFEFPNENGEPYRSSGGKMVESELGEIPEGWEVRSIGEIMDFSYGKALKKENRISGKFPVIGSNGIVDSHNEFLVKGPGIVIGRKGTIGETIWINDNFYPIDTTFYIETKMNLEDILYYFYFILKNQDFKKISSDSAVPGLNRNLAYMNKIVISSNKDIGKFITIIKESFHK